MTADREAQRRTEQLTASLEQLLDQVTTAGTAPCVYVSPAGELDARTAVLGLHLRRRPPRLFVSSRVPPGALCVTPDLVDDPHAREVHP